MNLHFNVRKYKTYLQITIWKGSMFVREKDRKEKKHYRNFPGNEIMSTRGTKEVFMEDEESQLGPER